MSKIKNKLFKKKWEIGQLFTPSTPINEKDLFAGRASQVSRIVDAVIQRGQHAIIYGERGVGKTSMSNVLASFLEGAPAPVLAPHVSVSTCDTFSELWRRVFSQLTMSQQIESMGFKPDISEHIVSLAQALPEHVTPDIVRHTLEGIGDNCLLVLIIDEFDRLEDLRDARLFADTIKHLSDYASPATIVLVGVADSVDRLLVGHESINRNLIQVPMPRMPRDELQTIVTSRLEKLEMDITPEALGKITVLSRGLPHYIHLLGQKAGFAAIDEGTKKIAVDHIYKATKMAIDDAQQSLRSGYHTATISSQKGNLYASVLLACALTKCNDFGYFSAADIREPIRYITGNQTYGIPNFAKHLSAFSSDARGKILEEKGEKYVRQFRFADPLMQTYVIMKGIATDQITMDDIDKFN